MQNVAFIINPFSAKKNYQPFLNSLQAKVENPLYLISKSIQDTENFIKDNFEKVDIFIAIGGDGTISTVAKNLIHTDKILGIFPAGSGNGFSNETKFSKNLDELLAKIQKKNFKEIDTFTVNERFSINVGDRYSNKLVGFHAASGNNVWYAAFLTLEDVSDIEMQRETDDPWWKFIVPGKPEDLPDGEEVEFIGRYRYTTLPVSSDSIKHWHLSPFANEFEEQLLPSPLGPRDPRILVDLPTNQIGMPSLLIAENSKMCAKLPPIEQFVLSK